MVLSACTLVRGNHTHVEGAVCHFAFMTWSGCGKGDDIDNEAPTIDTDGGAAEFEITDPTIEAEDGTFEGDMKDGEIIDLK